MPIENIEVTQQATNVIVTPPASTSLTVNQAAPINVEVATLGLQGAVGPTPDLDIGTVTTGAAGSSAAATITGTLVNPLLNLTIPRGNTGATGQTGAPGPANVLSVGTVTQLSPVSAPTTTITGTSPTQTINFGIPAGAKILTGTAAPAGGTGLQGDWYINTTTSDLYEKTAVSTWTLRSNIKGATGATGSTGATGPANQLSVDSVTASAPGSTPVVTIGGAAPTQTISFVLPRGDTGPTGPAPNMAIGTVTTVAAGGSATASVTGTNPNYSLNIGIPRGDKGEIGAQWLTGTAPPATGSGVIGDFYLVNSGAGLGDVYKKTGASTWTLQGNIRGAAGAGDVNSVNSVLPDVNGNVVLTWGNFTGTIPESALPAQAISDTFTVASQAAMLALTAQRGDYAIRTDEGSTYILTAEPASTLANWTLFRVNASNITTGTLPMGVIPTGTTGTSVALGNHGHSLTDANITGIIPNAKLPARLGNPEVEVVTDWDLALEPGFYYGSGTALNSPAAYATVGLVTRGANANNITQRLTAQADGNDAEFIRKRSAGVWGAWETTMSKTSTLDARYAQIVNAVMLTGAQTIAGVKTFSSSPIVPTPSAGTDATNKTYVDAGLGGKANTAHNHDTGAITTGTMDIARLPTGTTGTTVALGNHLHTGVYEPVIAAGTTSQYRRGDNTWRDLGSDAVLLTGAQTVAGTKTFSTPITVNAGQGWNAVYGTETINFSRAGANYIGSTTATGTLVFRLTNAAASDVIALTLSQSAGTPTATFGGPVVAGGTGFNVSSAGGRLATLTHTANGADGLILTNTGTANTSPRVFFQNDVGANTIYRTGTSLAFSTAATPGTTSGTPRITLSDTGDVTFADSVDVGGNIAVGSGSLTTAQLSNTATNPTAIGTGLGVNTAAGLLWRASGSGWAANLSNGNTGSTSHGLLVGTASTNAATGLFQLDSGTTNKFKIMGDGYLEHLSEITLGSVAGNYAISRKYRHAGGVNNFQLVDMMHRTGAGSDWVTAEIYQGIGIDSSYLTPTTIRTYMRRNPNTNVIGFGGSGADWLTLTAYSTTLSGVLNVPGTSYMSFGAVGVNPPTFTTQSAGTKIVLYSTGVTASLAEYAIGIESSHIWNSVDSNASTKGFKWYGGTTLAAHLTANGNLTTTGTITAGGAGFTGSVSATANRGLTITHTTNLADGAAFINTTVDFSPRLFFQSSGGGNAIYRDVGGLRFTSGGTPSVGSGTTQLTLNDAGNLTAVGTITAGGTGFAGAGANITGVIHTTGNESIAGVKTFTEAGGAIVLSNTNPEIQFTETDTAGAGRNYWLHHNGGVFYILQDRSGNGAWDSPHPLTIATSGTVTIGNTFVAASSSQFDGVATFNKGIVEQWVHATGTSGTVTLDASQGSVFALSPTGNVTTLSITNLPSTGNVVTITLVVYQGATAYTIATPAGGVFFGAATPTQVANKMCMFTYMSTDGGTSWLCSAAVQV